MVKKIDNRMNIRKPSSCPILKAEPFGIMYGCKENCKFYDECVQLIKDIKAGIKNKPRQR